MREVKRLKGFPVSAWLTYLNLFIKSHIAIESDSDREGLVSRSLSNFHLYSYRPLNRNCTLSCRLLSALTSLSHCPFVFIPVFLSDFCTPAATTSAYVFSLFSTLLRFGFQLRRQSRWVCSRKFVNSRTLARVIINKFVIFLSPPLPLHPQVRRTGAKSMQSASANTSRPST